MTRTPPKIPRPWPAPISTSPTIQALGENPSVSAVVTFWRTVAATMPLVEPTDDPAHVIVTFCWRDGEAEQVLLFANRLTDETDLASTLLERIGSTDIWHASYRMDARWRASYSFIPQYRGQPMPWLGANDQVAIRAALDRGMLDPLNPATCPNRAGVEQAVVELPRAPQQPWLRAAAGRPAGSVQATPGPGGRRVWTYVPADAGDDLPLVIALDGDVWTSSQSLATTLDRLIDAGQIPPVCAVMLDAGDRAARWTDLDSGGGIDDYIARELLPWARRSLPATSDRDKVVVVGQSLGGLTALRAGLRHADVIGQVLAQSSSLWADDVVALIDPASVPRVYLEVGTMEWVLAPDHRTLASALAESGIEVELAEFVGGHDYACWRGGVADGLIWLLGTRS